MKTQVILITLLFSLLSIQGYSATNDGEQTEAKKATKSKYDFNIFKMVTIDVAHPTDVDSTSIKSSLPYKRKED